MDIAACVDILKQRAVESENNVCPCSLQAETSSNSQFPVNNSDQKEEEDGLGECSALELISKVLSLQEMRVKSYSEFHDRFCRIMDGMRSNSGCGDSGTNSSINVHYVQTVFPTWCSQMTERFSEISRRIIQIKEQFESMSSVVTKDDTDIQTSGRSASTRQCRDAMKYIGDLQKLEKEKFTVFASKCLDLFRSKSETSDLSIGSTVLMTPEASLENGTEQIRSIEVRVGDILVELQDIKSELLLLQDNS